MTEQTEPYYLLPKELQAGDLVPITAHGEPPGWSKVVSVRRKRFGDNAGRWLVKPPPAPGRSSPAGGSRCGAASSPERTWAAGVDDRPDGPWW